MDGTYSLTDSPTSLYKSNTKSTATIPQTIDLSKAHKAKILFNARWAIEEDFDYAQIQASTDGINYFALCGKYTRVNNVYEVVYDGFQTSWIEEEIDLSDLAGNPKVYIRFLLSSDELNDFDGIYIDNFRVRVIEKFTTPTIDFSSDDLKLYPNPVNNELIVEGFGSGNYSILNSLGQEVLSGKLQSQSHIDVSKLHAGIYRLIAKSKTGLEVKAFTKQ